MNNHRRPTIIAIAVMTLLLGVPVRAVAQDPLTRARTLYESADYEEALQVLSTLKGPAATTEAAAYRVFCLVALGRRDEARSAVEAIVRADPLFHPAPAQVSPRMRAFFDEIRKPLLADIARQSYAAAKAAFDKKDWTAARDGFTRAIGLLDELKGDDDAYGDMRTVAAGFRDLAVSAIEAAAPVPTPSPTPIPTPTATPIATPTPSPVATPEVPPAAPVIYGEEDADVTKPVAIARPMPPWRPIAIEVKLTFEGALELVVSEEGKVLSASLIKKVNPRYDAALLAAAKTWTFRPATRDGAPVRYRYVMAVKLTGPGKEPDRQ